MRIKKQVSKKRSPFGTHRNADCLLKNTFTKQNKYVVNQHLEHFGDISVRELFGRIGVGFFLHILRFVPSIDKVFVSTFAIHFYKTQLD
jgi:hypothetical protein